jgi:hypothetical protein
MSPLISIVIPTQRRPEPLAAALASALAQRVDGVAIEVVVVDNDSAGSAGEGVLAAASDSLLPLRYVHAPEPGVANARNAGVAAAHGDFIAFLDDDEIAPEGWLAALMAVQIRFDADAVFGPVQARLPEGLIAHRDYLAAFFSRLGPEEACAILDGPGGGNSLVRKDALPDGPEPFARARNRIGGEDDLLFATMKTAGARFAWAPDAWVWEVPEPGRLRLGYTLRRAFVRGQGPCCAAASRGLKGWPMVPVWTAIGVLQVLVHGARAAMGAAARSPDLAFTLDRVAQGLGKMLWFPPFKIRFYGQAASAPIATHDPTQGETHERHQPLESRAGGELRPRQPHLPASAA